MQLVLSSIAAVLLASCSSVLAAPVGVAELARRSGGVTDVDILQFALTLEHLENVFYKQALTMFQPQQFTDAGFSPTVFENTVFIAHDEEAHVVLLQSAITAAGGTPVQACQYNFPITDVVSFMTLSSVLEGVGTSAYLGAAGLISSPAILGVAASILVTEALHTSAQRESINLVASPTTLGTPLGANAVFSLASGFITSCPSSNSPLPFTAFPALTATPGTPPTAGSMFTFQVTQPTSQQVFVTFVNALSTISVQGTVSNNNIQAQIPIEVAGQTFVFITNTQVTGPIQDSQITNGPAIIEVGITSTTLDFSLQ